MATVTGTTGNDTNLRGSWGGDTIDGGLGADIMYGGGGNDVYIVDNLGDVVREIPTFRITNNTAIQLVSVNGSTLGDSSSGVNAVTVSGTGNLVAFYSQASNLVAGDTPGTHEFVLRNMTTGELIWLETTSAGLHADQPGGDNGYSAIHITPNGRYVVFSSTSPDLVPSDTATDGDIFVKDLQTGAITIESEPYGDGVSAGYHTWAPDISGNGRYVVFSASEDLVGPVDANGVADSDVFWRDRQTGELRMVSGLFDGSEQGDSDSDNATVTDNGRFVLFESSATNFASSGDTNGASDLFVRDMVDDTVQLITVSTTGTTSANGSSYDGNITPNGRFVVYTSGADDLLEGDLNDSTNIYRQDLTTGDVVRVNTTSTGALAGSGQHAQITPDGRYVVFESTATTLVTVTGDSSLYTKIFVKDLVTGQIEMVSRTATGGALTAYSAYAPQISDDGQFIIFNTRADLNVQDSGTVEDVYRVPNPLYSPGDEVHSSVNFTLPADVENLVLTGSSAINGTGNTLRNVITGNTNNNILDGSAGNDTVNGGDGNDTLIGGAGTDALAGGNGTDTGSYAAATAAVTVNLALATAQNTGGAGTDTLGTIENLTGSAFNDRLTGNAGVNRLEGGNGNDILNGGEGGDIMVGGLGNDTYVCNADTDNISEAGNAGTDTVQSAVTWTLSGTLENLTLTGTAAINGTGNSADNVITGNTANNRLSGGLGNDTLNGGDGSDIMVGGPGNDTYVCNANTDNISEAGNAGTDTVQSAVTWTLGGTLENLTLTGTAVINGSGNSQNNIITGNVVNNLLSGFSGNDTLRGQGGADTLTGGLGADYFDFNAVADSGITAPTRDIITDFLRAQGDRIDLADVDANAALAGNQAFAFIGAAAFTGNATGKLRFDAANHLVLGSTDADTAAEFSIQVNGLASMLAADFIL